MATFSGIAVEALDIQVFRKLRKDQGTMVMNGVILHK